MYSGLVNLYITLYIIKYEKREGAWASIVGFALLRVSKLENCLECRYKKAFEGGGLPIHALQNSGHSAVLTKLLIKYPKSVTSQNFCIHEHSFDLCGPHTAKALSSPKHIYKIIKHFETLNVLRV